MGLLDWLTDGGGSLWNDEAKKPFINATNGYGGPGGQPDAGMPPPQMTGADAPPMQPPMPPQMRPTGERIPPMNFQRPEFDPSRMPMPPGSDPMTAGGSPPNGPGLPPPSPPMPPGTDPMTAGGEPSNGPGLPPPPLPQARPVGAPPAPGAAQPLTPDAAGAAYDSYKAAGGGGQVQIAGQPPSGPGGVSPVNMQGGGGILGALGVGQDSANRMRGAVGAGLKAAGDSSGKSPMQALASGAGSALEGGQKASDINNDQTLKYLNAAISAQRAGDTQAYNLNYTKYLAAKLKADTDKAASGGAKGNSPERLYFDAVRATNSDPSLKGHNDAIRAARASGDTAALAKAQADLEQAKAGIMNGHLGRVGLDPQTAATIAQQPGNTVGNAIDAGKMGITEKNIAQKLQPGQYYRNPKDGQIYQFNGGPGNAKTPDKPTTPEPRDPNKPERGTRASADTSDEAEG